MSKQFLIGFAIAALCAGSALAADGTYAPQVSNQREIKVTVTLQNTPSDAKTWDFEIVMETHAHDLGDSMNEASMLLVDGKRFFPMDWKGSPPGGQHRKGILRFRTVNPKPASIELQISLGHDTKPRSFKWRLK